jgi:hypothetical protein
MVVLTIAMLIGGNMVLPWLPVLFVILALLAMFTTGIALVLASCNVFFHDVELPVGGSRPDPLLRRRRSSTPGHHRARRAAHHLELRPDG